MSQGSNASDVIDPDPAPHTEPLESSWPVSTDVLYQAGSNRITLRGQRPLLRVVLQDAMENVRADLMFTHSFPVSAVGIATIRMSLLTAASQYRGAASIYRRLLSDEEYMTTLTPLVSFSTTEMT
jgi:hypothetical protein